VKKWSWWVLFAGLIALIAFLAYKLLYQPDLKNRGAALEELLHQVPAGGKDLAELVVTNYKEYRGNAVRWSAAYFGCLFGSAFLSTLAGVVLKWEHWADRPALKNDLAASFAAASALLITISTMGNFGRVWEANRTAASAMENLAYEILKPEMAADRSAIVEKIRQINEARTAEILGRAAPSRPKVSGQPEGAQ